VWSTSLADKYNYKHNGEMSAERIRQQTNIKQTHTYNIDADVEKQLG